MNDELMAQFLVEGRELVADAARGLTRLAETPDDAAALDGCFRALHTLKGSTGLFDLAPMGTLLHAAEDWLAAFRDGRDPRELAHLFDVVDRIDSWLDALERDATLPPDAAQVARDLAKDPAASAVLPAAAAPALRAGWVPPPGLAALPGTAFRYLPRSDAYFSGDDPLAILAALPGLTALRISPREPWGPRALYDPFSCNLCIEAVSSASAEALRAGLRLVADQVEIAESASTTRPAGRATLRVDAARVDRLAGLMEDLLIARSHLAELAAQVETMVDDAIAQPLRARRADLERLVNELHATVGAVRLMPLAPLFERFPRLARELARSLGKPFRFETEGGGIELDKAIVDGLFEPILHVLRNAVDHGLEAPAARLAAGKAAEGSVRLVARSATDRVTVELIDDGAGIDPARIRDLAVARRLLTRASADVLPDAQATALVFQPGFSTSAAVSDLSGRGVGMDAVRNAVVGLGGTVAIVSTPGDGTAIRFVLPVAGLLRKLMVVGVDGARYGIPLDSVVETARVPADRIRRVRQGEAFLLRGQPIPLFRLSALLGGGIAGAQAERVVIVLVQGEPVALAVDAIHSTMEAVARPLAGLLAALRGVNATTLLNDGTVLLVLDPEELLPS